MKEIMINGVVIEKNSNAEVRGLKHIDLFSWIEGTYKQGFIEGQKGIVKVDKDNGKMEALEKTYFNHGIDESIEVLKELKRRNEMYNSARYVVFDYLKEKEKLYDGNGKRIEEGHIMSVNPNDDSWLDIVIRYCGVLIFASELSHEEPVRLRECLQGSDNPAIIVGHLNNNRLGFFEW